MKHEHSYSRRRAGSTVETCTCGRFRFTENAGPAIVAVESKPYEVEDCQECDADSVLDEQHANYNRMIGQSLREY